MQGVLKEGLPTDQVIAELAHYLMKSEIWKRVGRALGIGEPHITQIQEDESCAYERVYRMLSKWRQLMGAGANYEALAHALKCEHVGRPDLAQQFCYSAEVAQGNNNNNCLRHTVLETVLKYLKKNHKVIRILVHCSMNNLHVSNFLRLQIHITTYLMRSCSNYQSHVPFRANSLDANLSFNGCQSSPPPS